MEFFPSAIYIDREIAISPKILNESIFIDQLLIMRLFQNTDIFKLYAFNKLII